MPFTTQPPIPIKEKISVKYIVEKLRNRVNINLVCCAAEDCCTDRYVREADLHRPGLALAGCVKLFTFQRIQIIGNTESQYLENKSKEEQIEAFNNLMQFQIPVIFLTDGNILPDYLIELAEKAGIPIYRTPYETTRFMFLLRDFLDDQFALQTVVHGAMVDVYGIGILIVGRSCSDAYQKKQCVDGSSNRNQPAFYGDPRFRDCGCYENVWNTIGSLSKTPGSCNGTYFMG